MSDSEDNDNNDNDDAYLEVANNQIKLVSFASTSTNYLYSLVICTSYIHNYLCSVVICTTYMPNYLICTTYISIIDQLYVFIRIKRIFE